MSVTAPPSRVAFGLFEADLQSGELRKAGFRIKLQSQPFRVLAILLEHSGQVVTREDLQLRLWGPDTMVDFDHSLGTAINKIREALGDSSENPRFVETLSRRGYRFIAPVRSLDEAPAHAATDVTSEDSAHARPAEAQPSALVFGQTEPLALPILAPRVPPTITAVPRALRPWHLAVMVGAASLAAGGGMYLVGRSVARPPLRLQQLTHNGRLAASSLTMDSLTAAVTNGVYLYVSTFDHGRVGISAVSLADGSVLPLNVPDDVAGPALGDISPDGSRLLLRNHLSPEAEQPLWIVPTLGGSAQRVGSVLAHDATWMPDGQSVLFANGEKLYLTGANGIGAEVFATLPGRAFWLRWSPDGKLLRFTIADPEAHTLTLWQLSARDHNPVQLLAGFHQPASECCGVWADDGRAFVFRSSRDGNNDIWRLNGTSTTGARRVTDGPLQFEAPVAARNGSAVYFVGADVRSEMDRLTPAGTLVPLTGMLADAERVEYSHDAKWVAWTDSRGQLFRARADGRERLQVTPDSLNVFLAQWSLDGQHLAFMARRPGEAWSIYVVNADGSGLRQLVYEHRNAADPSWSPDGNTIVFGRTNDRMGQEAAPTLEYVDVRTGAITAVPGSEGVFSPRWSPDGRFIVALSLDQRRVMLFDVAAKSWNALPVLSGADPVWTPDSRAVLLHGSLSASQPIDRISIPDGHVTELAQLASSTTETAADFVFCGIDADGTPLIRVRMYTGDFYSTVLQK